MVIITDINGNNWFNIIVDPSIIDVYIQWCRENFERDDWVYTGNGMFYFKNENDVTLFTLRWLYDTFTR
jgi:hypothetical protein